MRTTDGTGWGSRAAGRVVATMATAAAVAGLAVAGLLFVLRPLAIALPAAGLDSSWMAVLGEAAARPARWGVDLAFTYGPASALATRYFTEGYLAAALPALAGLALVNALVLVLLARDAAAGRRFGGALVAAALAAEVAALAAELALDQDSFVFALALALLLLDLVRRPGRRGPLLAVLAGAALLGASTLTKTSYGIAALGAFAIADARAALASRRPPLLVPVWCAAALAAFLLCGQRLGDLPAYLDLQGQVAAGYGEAMYLPPNRVELALFLCSAAALVGVAGACGAPGRWGRPAAALGTAFVLAIAVKAGFVRADTHTQIAWSLLGLAGTAVAVGLALRRSARGAALLAAASLAALWVVGPLFLLSATERKPALAGLGEVYRDMGAVLAVEAGAWDGFLRSPSDFAEAARQGKAAAWRRIAAAQPVPALDGTVDILPSEQTALLAGGADYRPRPSFQDYSTYTAGLIAADTAFYAGPDAPAWVIFGAGALDDRHPNTVEGALWPELLSRYEPVRRIGDWLALHRRAAPLPPVLGPPTGARASLGATIAVPERGPTFVRIALPETPLGRIAAALFRPPALVLRLDLVGGGQQVYRFIPAIGAAGFLLTPVVTDPDGFADLAIGAGDAVGGAEVASFAVVGSRWAGLFYGDTLAVEFRRVAVPPSPPGPGAEPFRAELAAQLPWRRLAHALGRDLAAGRLSAQAPTALSIPTDGARRLRVAFGIEDGAWTQGHTQGVCFAVQAPSAAAPLWRRCLDPAAVPADRGPQSAEVAVPPGTPSVTAATSCAKGCDWGWSYWSDIAPEE